MIIDREGNDNLNSSLDGTKMKLATQENDITNEDCVGANES